MIGELIPVEETRAGRDLIERGLERGLERGIHVGVDEVLFVQLERVCGQLDEIRRARVEALTVPIAKELALALLDFRGMADLDAWLEAHG